MVLEPCIKRNRNEIRCFMVLKNSIRHENHLQETLYHFWAYSLDHTMQYYNTLTDCFGSVCFRLW